MEINKDTVREILSDVIDNIEFYEHRNQISVIVPREKLLEVSKILKDNPKSSFDQLIDVTAIDFLKKKEHRFEVVYFLYSTSNKLRLKIKVPLTERDPHVESVVSIWKSADWYEREAYDMYGIIFDNHPDLRRFYMPEDYVDPESGEPIYPLRKDFPLMGIPESLPLPAYPEKYGEVL